MVPDAVETICREAQELAERGGDLNQMVMDLLAKVGRDRGMIESALVECERRSGPEGRPAQLLRNALATGLFD